MDESCSRQWKSKVADPDRRGIKLQASADPRVKVTGTSTKLNKTHAGVFESSCVIDLFLSGLPWQTLLQVAAIE